MKKDWLRHSLILANTPADFYSGARKIIRGRSIVFDDISNDLSLQDAGFTKSKLTMLTRNYLNQPSVDAALTLWRKRLEQDKYGSVGVSTYNHFMKGDVKGATPRGSVFGPCIQSFTLTLIKEGVAVDVFYRTTEWFKKFPADLVFLRDVLLSPFDISPLHIRFHFANITLHPMYFVTILPHLPNPVSAFEDLRRDTHFYNWCVKWTARYICPENMRGIQKFSQAMRVRQDAHSRIDKKMLKRLETYLRANHPGYRNEYEDIE